MIVLFDGGGGGGGRLEGGEGFDGVAKLVVELLEGLVTGMCSWLMMCATLRGVAGERGSFMLVELDCGLQKQEKKR